MPGWRRYESAAKNATKSAVKSASMTRVGWIRLAVIALAVGALELACRTGLVDHRVMIPPSEMADALFRLLISGRVNDAMARTFGIVLAAVVLAVVFGF